MTSKTIDAEIDAMEAGLLLDVAVAEAIGMDARATQMPYGRRVTGLYDDRGLLLAPFHPSNSWDAAMFAAERFGLFGRHRNNSVWHHLNCFDGEWAISWQAYSDTEDIATAPTGPLAICRAILKLSRRPA